MPVLDEIINNPERYEEMIEDDDIIVIPLPSLLIEFVFKRDLTPVQITTFLGVFTNFQQESDRVFNLKIDLNEEYDFLECRIPCELANLLCYIKCWDKLYLNPPTIFFKSELLVRRRTLIVRVSSELRKPRGIDNAMQLYDILNPILFNNSSLRSGMLDIFTAEIIASHFFFNPKIVMSTHKNGVIVSYSRCQEDEIRSAYNNTQKIMVIDESQKVKMYDSNTEAEKEIGNIETWLKKSSAHYIRVKSATDDSVHRIFSIIRHDRLYSFFLGDSYNKYRILAFM